MELYKLPESLAIASQDNKIPPFSLKVDFADGPFADHSYAPITLNALWTLIGGSLSLESETFFEIERSDCDFKLQGFGNQAGFCLFQDTYDASIKILGNPTIDVENLDLLQVVDGRWPLTYFLPKAALIDFSETIQLANTALQNGELSEFLEFPQTFADLGLPEGYC